MSHKKELKHRVEAKKKHLESEIEEIKADATSDARENLEKIQGQLAELKEYIKDGWDKVTEGVAKKINDWLKRD